MTNADLLRSSFVALEVNDECTEAALVLHDDSRLHFVHRVGERTARALGPEAFDIATFEQASLARIGMPAEIAMRHRPTHFSHVFSGGGGYASAYYSYMWSEVLDCDAFAAFEEAHDIFDPPTAKRLHECIYSAGGSRDPAELYTSFRGRLPAHDALLRRRGLLVEADARR